MSPTQLLESQFVPRRVANDVSGAGNVVDALRQAPRDTRGKLRAFDANAAWLAMSKPEGRIEWRGGRDDCALRTRPQGLTELFLTA